MPLLPFVKSMYLCDQIRVDATTNKLDIIGVGNVLRLPQGDTFPYIKPKFGVVSQLAGGIGTIEMICQITLASSGQVIYQSQPHRLTFTQRHMTLFYAVKLSSFPFPSRGVYLVELFCDGSFVEDQLYHVWD